ncbi:LytR C-terminal domain-containing protein [Boudabousia marimammalium]|uniref:LytR/CpsA/Psr regulator C-terminal domain-containing protein n=1 Tax=Boudabousia marimammalium TaxID=156892 RepID=A0A1Q5PJ75_9ACTO|nr:LytR C-terminal domain-containing protein [Boudabousia marimammalium]OKL45917.1 hypothetical protein BM477_07890 [Boudabousia marimammalium]
MNEEQYPADEFDVTEGAHPRGVHRAPEPWWRWMLPFLVVLIAVPALAWGAMYLLSPSTVPPQAGGTASTPEVTAETVEAVKSVETPETGTMEKPEAQAPATEEQPAPAQPSAEVKKDTKVRVLNGTGKRGLAANVVKKLSDNGFKQGVGENAKGWASRTSAVYYPNDDLKATAEEIAKTLNINAVKDYKDGNKGEVVVLLRNDFNL